MTTGHVGGTRGGEVRAGAAWLALREDADAAARSVALVEEVRAYLPRAGAAVIHDLGCGSGSMARWLAPQLRGPQHWVLHDRDAELLALAERHPPRASQDHEPVTVETRRGDITRLDPATLDGSTLVTGSALLDMLTEEEIDRLVGICAQQACPVLITLSVVGHVELDPVDPLDPHVTDAFNAHQRRTAGSRTLLGPDAAGATADGLRRSGLDVVVRPSPWRLGTTEHALIVEWLAGWLAAACEQRPELTPDARSYARRRLAQADSGRLFVPVQHEDRRARPR